MLILATPIVGAVYGYINNIIELSNTDFKAPYKAEVIRTVGIIVPPVGIIAGYIEINDKQEGQ